MLKKIAFIGLGLTLLVSPSLAAAQSTSSTAQVTVVMMDDYFTPTNVTVHPGDTVTWINQGSMSHTVTADNGSFDSGTIAPGASFSAIFPTAGTYAYHCKFHGGAGGEGMSGTVKVTSSTGTGTGNNVTMTVPGSVTLTTGQTAIWQHPGYVNDGSPLLTLNSIDTNQGGATDARVTVVTGYCESVSASGTAQCPNTTANAALTLNVPQILGGERFTLTSLSLTTATISVASDGGTSFTVPGTAAFSAVGQTATDSGQGYVLTLNTANAAQSSANVTLVTQTPCNPGPGGDCAIAIYSTNTATLALNQAQTVSGLNLTLASVTASSASINLATSTSTTCTAAVGDTTSCATFTASPTSGAAPLAVTLTGSGLAVGSYPVDFGDGASGSIQVGPPPCASGNDCSGYRGSGATSHSYTSAGTYTAKSMYQPPFVCNAPAGAACAQVMPALQTVTATITVTGTTTAPCLAITHNLGPEDRDAATNGDVTRLQQFLAQDPSIYPEGLITGFYGPATQRAVQRWQAAHNIVSSGTPETTGYGAVGPTTRAAMVGPCGTAAGKFTATPTSGSAPLKVTFDGIISANSYVLDFGDSSTPLSFNCTNNCSTITIHTTHSYASSGTYVATLHGTCPSTGSNQFCTVPQYGTATITVGTGTTTPTGVCKAPTHDLSLGVTDSDVGGDVTVLQNFLVLQGTSIYPQGLITGFYGNATQAGVVRFQQAVKISPTGFVGPLTRAAIAAECSGSTPTVPTPSTTKYSFSATPASGQAPLSVNFTAVNADTLESGAFYRVDFGDGTHGDMTAGATAGTLSVSHSYAQGGTFSARLLQERNICGGIMTGYGCDSELQVDIATVTVSAPAATTTATTTTTAAPAAPSTCTMSFSDNPVTPGQAIYIKWSSTQATGVYIEPGIGYLPGDGIRYMPAPQSTTQYICTGYINNVGYGIRQYATLTVAGSSAPPNMGF